MRTEAGQEVYRPSSENGIYVDGPLTSEDWKRILEGIIEEMVEQAKREANQS